MKPWVRDMFSHLRRRVPTAFGARPPVGYIGWVGQNNLGDEAVYSAISRLFNRIHVDPYAPGRREAYLQRVGLGGPGFFRAIVLGGGTLVNAMFLETVRGALAANRDLYMFGTGVGSPGFGVSPEVDLSGWPEVLKSFRFLSVRGPHSQRLLQLAGVADVEVIGDPALGHAVNSMPSRRLRPRLIVNLTEPEPTHVGSLCHCAAAVAGVSKKFFADGGEVIPVVLGDGDQRPLRTFAREAGCPIADPVDCRNDVGLFMDTVRGSVALIGVRLHSAVLACCVGVPPLLFGYRAKCSDFMESMNLSNQLVEFSEAARDLLPTKWRTVVQDCELGSQILNRAQYWRGVQAEASRRILARYN